MQMILFFAQKPLPAGTKIIVPRVDQTTRWAMQPGTPANKNRTSTAASKSHASVLRCPPEKELPFLRRIGIRPPFCVVGPSYAAGPFVVLRFELWYNES